MGISKWNAGIIRPIPVAPTGPYSDGAAPGIWSLDQVAYWTKQGLWPIAGNTAPYGIFGGGFAPDYVNTINRITIATTGNASDFGDLSTKTADLAACGSSTRGVFGGGTITGGSAVSSITFKLFSSSGNTASFGNLTLARSGFYACSNATRGIFAGGLPGSAPLYTNVIDYITIATEGNATDFGDTIPTIKNEAACASTTRGVFAGGDDQGTIVNVIQYVTIASTGNATDFGDLVGDDSGRYRYLAGCSSSTRGIFGGGRVNSPSAVTNSISYITIATAGNSTDFGDLTVARDDLSSCSSSTRGIFAGGETASYQNVIDYITIATTGNATDFGDLLTSTGFLDACSNVHGGL